LDKETKFIIAQLKEAIILTECFILRKKNHCNYGLALKSVKEYKKRIRQLEKEDGNSSTSGES